MTIPKQVAYENQYYYLEGVGLWCLTPLSQYLGYIVVVSFIGGGNRNIR
jgi:hypothetical protein